MDQNNSDYGRFLRSVIVRFTSVACPNLELKDPVILGSKNEVSTIARKWIACRITDTFCFTQPFTTVYFPADVVEVSQIFLVCQY